MKKISGYDGGVQFVLNKSTSYWLWMMHIVLAQTTCVLVMSADGRLVGDTVYSYKI